MREILFRGRRIDNDEWVEGYLIQSTEIYGIPSPHTFIVNHEHPQSCFGNDIYKEVIPETLSQFTGLYDKNGVRIFEGDIIDGFDELTYWDRGRVYWDERRYQLVRTAQNPHCSSFPLDPTGIYEVIGNIYDNPELLEKDKSNEN